MWKSRLATYRTSIASSTDANERSPRSASACSSAIGGGTQIAGSRSTARSTRSGDRAASSITSRPPKLCPIHVAASIPSAPAVSSRSPRCAGKSHGGSHSDRP